MLREGLFIFTVCLTANLAFGEPSISAADPDNEVTFANITAHQREVLNEAYASLVPNIKNIMDHLEKFALRHEIIQTKPVLQRIYQKAKKMDVQYNKFLNLTDPKYKTNEKNIEFADGVLHQPRGNTHAVCASPPCPLIDNEFKRFVQLLNSSYYDIYPVCGPYQTKQRLFYELALSMLNHYFKAYSMFTYAHQIYNEHYTYPHFHENVAQLNLKTREGFLEVVNLFSPIIYHASRTMRECDLQKDHKEDVTYTYLKNLFTRIFVYNINIKTKNHDGCSWGCPRVQNIVGIECVGPCEIEQRTCKNLVQCDLTGEHKLYLEGDKTKLRRYTGVTDYFSVWDRFISDGANEKLISKALSCSENAVCDCVCDESEHADRYFSLDEVTANIKLNYVVTGIKLVKKNGIIRLQIQEGQILPNALINQTSVKWTSLDKQSKYFSYEINGGNQVANDDFDVLKNDRRHHNVSWAENRGIFLNTVKAPTGHVVTGVRFSKSHIEEENFLNIEIQSANLNYSTGELESPEWIIPPPAENFQKNMIDLNQSDAPTNAKDLHVPDSIDNKLTRFVTTSVLSKDTGSSVVPYLDIQPVYSPVAAPLSSVGLDLMSANKSGGYLILKAETFDVATYF